MILQYTKEYSLQFALITLDTNLYTSFNYHLTTNANQHSQDVKNYQFRPIKKPILSGDRLTYILLIDRDRFILQRTTFRFSMEHMISFEVTTHQYRCLQSTDPNTLPSKIHRDSLLL